MPRVATNSPIKSHEKTQPKPISRSLERFTYDSRPCAETKERAESKNEQAGSVPRSRLQTVRHLSCDRATPWQGAANQDAVATGD